MLAEDGLQGAHDLSERGPGRHGGQDGRNQIAVLPGVAAEGLEGRGAGSGVTGRPKSPESLDLFPFDLGIHGQERRRRVVLLAVRIDSDHDAPALFDLALGDVIARYDPHLIVLAGFLRVLTQAFVERFAGKLINIHPSLLPAFPGLHTHRRALEEGVRIHGCTVHFVTPRLDGGPIIVQAAVPVLSDDTEETLAARVLQQEHLVLPQAVRWFLDGRLQVQGNRVLVSGARAYPDAIASPVPT